MREESSPLRFGKKSRLSHGAEAWHRAEHLNLAAHCRTKAERDSMRTRLMRLRREIMRDDLIQVRESELRGPSAED